MRRALNALYWLAGPLGPLYAWRIGQTYGRKLGVLILTHASR